MTALERLRIHLQATTVSASDHLGIDLSRIPPITAFVDTIGGHSSRFMSPQLADHPAWVSLLLSIAGEVTRHAGMAVVIAELSVLTDTLGHDQEEEFFTSNIVCLEESSAVAAGDSILDAYLSAIQKIARGGTTINTPAFHALHYVHVSGPAKNLGRRALPTSTTIGHYRSNVSATPLSKKYRRKNKAINFEGHHRDFFLRFLATLKAEDSLDDHDTLHYLALPFQRPEHLKNVPGAQQQLRLEPAGALYLVLQNSEGSNSVSIQSEAIAAVASHLQYVCTLSCLVASSFIADTRAISAATNEGRLKAYDGIGHALRAFVEATKYEGALELLSEVQHDERLPADLAKAISHVRKSLAFFEHAEALGSLMRLHGWLGIHGYTTQAHTSKVLECFDEDAIREINDGRLDETLISASVAAFVSLSSALAYKDDVTFRIHYMDIRTHQPISVIVDPDLAGSDEITPERAFPPLRTEGDRGAVFLAIRVALLEPLRNASMHVRGGSSPCVEILLKYLGPGKLVAFIGNKWRGAGATAVDMLTLSTGIRLVARMLQDCHLGRFFNPNRTEINTQWPLFGDADYANHVWIGIELDPLGLYAFARAGM